MDPKSYWERIYHDTIPTQASWYQPHALRSLSLIRRVQQDLSFDCSAQ